MPEEMKSLAQAEMYITKKGNTGPRWETRKPSPPSKSLSLVSHICVKTCHVCSRGFISLP